MVLYSMLRRASSSVLPLGIRAAGASRTFHAVATAATPHRGNLSRELTRGSFVPFVRFSLESNAKHIADKSLLRIIESEIECAEQTEAPDAVEEIPRRFPFEIQDNPGERTILLARKFEDEIIKVEVDIPNVSAASEDDDKAEDEHDEEDFGMPLVVCISKLGNGLQLEFGVTALNSEIIIDSLSIKQPEASEERLAYEGPEFTDLDENLRKAFHHYLEVRGIEPSTTNFLHQYMTAKDGKEYKKWLKSLKNFVEH